MCHPSEEGNDNKILNKGLFKAEDGSLNKIVERLRGTELSTDNNTPLEWSYFGKGIILAVLILILLYQCYSVAHSAGFDGVAAQVEDVADEVGVVVDVVHVACFACAVAGVAHV